MQNISVRASIKKCSIVVFLLFGLNALAVSPAIDMGEDNKKTTKKIRKNKGQKRKIQKTKDGANSTIRFRRKNIPNIHVPIVSSLNGNANVRRQSIHEIVNGSYWNGRKVRLSFYEPIDYDNNGQEIRSNNWPPQTP